MDVTRELAGVFRNPRPILRRRQGVVTAVGASTVDVTLGGSAVAVAGVPVIAPGMPGVGDTVWLLDSEGDVLVFGSAVSPRTPFASSAGADNVTLVSAATGSVTITFPAGRFTVAPIVTATVQTSTFWTVGVSAISSTGATLSVRHINGTLTSGTVPVHWNAIQSTPTAASG